MATDTTHLMRDDTLDTSYENDEHVTENLLDTEESFMVISPSDKISWSTMISEQKRETTSRKEKFENWLKEVTKKRTSLIPRMNKLLEKYQERNQLLENTNTQIKRAVKQSSPKSNGSSARAGFSSKHTLLTDENKADLEFKDDDVDIK